MIAASKAKFQAGLIGATLPGSRSLNRRMSESNANTQRPRTSTERGPAVGVPRGSAAAGLRPEIAAR